jgi:hypothetical protein
MRVLTLLTPLCLLVSAAEPLQQNLDAPGGGHFAITLSACRDKEPQLNGYLTNHTGRNWLYAEIQVKVTHGKQTETYRLNLERIPANGRAFRQAIDGAANQDCESFRLGNLELIAAQPQN